MNEYNMYNFRDLSTEDPSIRKNNREEIGVVNRPCTERDRFLAR